MVNVLFEYHTVFTFEVYYTVLELTVFVFWGLWDAAVIMRIYDTEKD